jgi:holin-like protein
MKYLKQFMLIVLISFLGEVLKMILPLPIPASVYGLFLMLVLLMTGIIRTSQVKETAFFLIEIMPVMFIPAAAGLIDTWPVLQPVLIPVSVIIFVITVVVMAVTGLISQKIMQKKEAKQNHG